MAGVMLNQRSLTTYTAVQQDESGPCPTSQHRPSRKWHKSAFLLALLTSFVGLAFYITGHYFGSIAQPLIETSEKSCGFTAKQALERGCHFDLMSFSWLPNECYDEELIQEFESLQRWHWYSDPEGKQEISRPQVSLGEAEALFVSFEYHRAHCVFMWKKLHRAYERGGFVDGYIGNYNHTSHCGHMLLMEGENLKTLNTQILRKFPPCGPAAT